MLDMDTSFGECVNQKQVSVIHEMENKMQFAQPKNGVQLYRNWANFQMRKHWFDYVVGELVFMI